MGKRTRNRREIDLNSILDSIFCRTVGFCGFRIVFFLGGAPSLLHCNSGRPCDSQADSVHSTLPTSPGVGHMIQTWTFGEHAMIVNRLCRGGGNACFSFKSATLLSLIIWWGDWAQLGFLFHVITEPFCYPWWISSSLGILIV